MQKDKFAEKIVEREGQLRSQRGDIEALWQEIAQYVVPERATFNVELSDGTVRSRYILDSTAPRSLEQFASFIFSLLNNPSIQWFKMRLRGAGKEVVENTEVKQWLETVEKKMSEAMSSEQAGLYQNLHTYWIDTGAFGNAVLYEDAPDGVLRTYAFHLNDVVFEENAYGHVHAVFRQVHYTEDQARERFGDDAITEDKKREQGSKIKFIHAVFPTNPQMYGIGRHTPDGIASMGFPFVSVWVNCEDTRVVQANGVDEFPYQIGRWYKTRTSIHGRSPAMTVLPDIRMVNRMMETILRGAEKLVDPPMQIPDGALVSPLRLFPGGITFTDGEANINPLLPPGASRIDVGDALLKDRQQAIRDGFFVPLFATPDSPVKTATQVLQEVDERNRAIAPMLIRAQSELFHGLIRRVFGLLSRAGAFPDPPTALQGTPASIGIEYVSPLSSSQQQLEALGTVRLFESLAGWAQIDPGVFDGFDSDKAALAIHAGSGAPQSIKRSDRERDRVRQARAEQQQMEQQMAMMQQGVIPAVEAGAKVAAAQKK